MRYLSFDEYLLKEQMPENKGWLRKKVIEFFTKTTELDDSKVHKLAEDLGLEHSELENEIYAILVSFLQAGKYNKAIEENEVDINQEELEVGIRFEMEHTTDANISRRIALDHLVDDPLYYTHLAEMETKYKSA